MINVQVFITKFINLKKIVKGSDILSPPKLEGDRS
jgi:hypothetical protein